MDIDAMKMFSAGPQFSDSQLRQVIFIPKLIVHFTVSRFPRLSAPFV
jgi:hypothetical protein